MFIDITEQVMMEQEQARLKAQNQYLQEEIEKQHIIAVLNQTNWKVSGEKGAAKILE